MLRYTALALALLLPATRQAPIPSDMSAPDAGVQGRWDLTLATPDGPRPSWMEIRHSGRSTLVGDFVGIVGSARPISRIDLAGDSIRFAVPPQWEEGTGDLVLVGRLQGERMSGSITFPDGKRFDWTGIRAPSLRRQAKATWGTPVHLLHASDLGGWRAVGGENQWVVANGVLRSPHSGANLVTERTFGDFKLHVEFRYPKGSNSGVYLRGRHEVQIQDDFGLDPATDRFSGVYGFLAPTEMMARAPNEWQTYDITLIGRRITVVANGRTVICDREIPGITGGAIDSDEGAPGPLLLQGDHGPVEYRNIILTPAR